MSKMIFKGNLVTGDFQNKTMTFEIEGEMTLQGGSYTILPTQMYEELVNGAKSELKALHIDSVSNSALHKNQKLVENMCISYRHDFGLLMTAERNQIRRECEEWLRAYENNREHCC